VSYCDQRRLPDELPELVDRLEAQIGRVFGRFHLNPTDAEDVLQETLLQFLLRRHEIVSPDTWLLGTLRKQCLMYWRRRRRALLESVDTGLLIELAGGDGARQENDDLSRDLSRAVGKLPERCRSLLRLRYGLGCENPEVAERMGYSPTGIRTITNRCLTALANQMVANGFEAYST
jgi:RNA polymerase sigma factor (sigma-70 family)